MLGGGHRVSDQSALWESGTWIRLIGAIATAGRWPMPRTPTSVETVRSITWPDGSICRLGIWEADDPSRPVLVVAPAMGAAVAYYRPFFNRLHRAGFSVVAMD